LHANYCEQKEEKQKEYSKTCHRGNGIKHCLKDDLQLFGSLNYPEDAQYSQDSHNSGLCAQVELKAWNILDNEYYQSYYDHCKVKSIPVVLEIIRPHSCNF
jgi:hypothetical protein